MSLQPTKKVIYADTGLMKAKQPLRKKAFYEQRRVTPISFKITEISSMLSLSFKVTHITFLDYVLNLILRLPKRFMELLEITLEIRYTCLLDFCLLTS